MSERYAIFTSVHTKSGHIPTLMIESEEQEAVIYYREGKERSRDLWADKRWGGKRDELWQLNLYGNSYSDMETGVYDKSTKRRIDAIIRTGKLPADEERKIIDQRKVWSRDDKGQPR